MLCYAALACTLALWKCKLSTFAVCPVSKHSELPWCLKVVSPTVIPCEICSWVLSPGSNAPEEADVRDICTLASSKWQKKKEKSDAGGVLWLSLVPAKWQSLCWQELWGFDSSVGGSHQNKREAQTQGKIMINNRVLVWPLLCCGWPLRKHYHWLYLTRMKQNALVEIPPRLQVDRNWTQQMSLSVLFTEASREVFFFRSQSQRWAVAHRESRRQGPTDHFDLG